MNKHLGGTALIFIGASLAWMILGSTLLTRTNESNDSQTDRLTAQWGSPQVQTQPQITAAGGAVVPLSGSRINVDLNLTQRRKGLLWYNLYNVSFAAHYLIRNDTTSPYLDVYLPFPSSNGTYTDFVCSIGGKQIADPTAITRDKVKFFVAPGRQTTLDVRYNSDGMESWVYAFGGGVQPVSNFAMTMTTDFGGYDFPSRTMLPTKEDRLGARWRLTWDYGTLVTANDVGLTVPYPLQPGPLAQRITFWAPVALLFYLFVMLVVTTLRNVDLHPVNYFFLAAAFFAFHLLFAYLVDRIPLEWAFAICSLVSMFLTISYLRLVAGWRFAAVESALAQLVYLILFSYALFNEGWSGLSITIGVIITLFVIMQVTGRTRWGERFDAAA